MYDPELSSPAAYARGVTSSDAATWSGVRVRVRVRVSPKGTLTPTLPVIYP